MFIPYAQNDIVYSPDDTFWFGDRLVGCHHERSGISHSVKKAVLQFGDNYKVQSGPGASPISKISDLAPVKHHVSYDSICKALYTNMINRGTASGEGMTRDQSVTYLRWILEKLGSPSVKDDVSFHGPRFDITEFEPPVPKKPGMRQAFDDENSDWTRQGYESWVSWAVGLICDWPENLFCGQSSGDGNGRKTDWPINMATSDRVRKAAEKMRYYIYDLSIGPYAPYDSDSANVMTSTKVWDVNLITDQTYEPDKNGDEWWLPYTYEEQLEFIHQNQIPSGPDIIKDSQDLPIDFTESQ